MAQTYDDYSAERRARLSPEGKVAVEVFSRAYAVGTALAGARQQRELTQSALAKLSGVEQADISRIERGLLAPTTPTLLRLVEALHARLTIELVGDDEPWPASEPVVLTTVARQRLQMPDIQDLTLQEVATYLDVDLEEIRAHVKAGTASGQYARS
jgi:XRE family transcriptional regulator, regulator of sulfur utilization